MARLPCPMSVEQETNSTFCRYSGQEIIICHYIMTFLHCFLLFIHIHPSPKVTTVFFFWFLTTFQSEECFQFWRKYDWIWVQQFHKTNSGAKCLTQCVPRSKCDAISFFKMKFVLKDLLDLVKFIVFLWKFLHLEIDTPTPFLPCFMVIEPVDTKPWPEFRQSVAFEWQYFLQSVGTSVAGIIAAAIGRIFDIPGGQYEVSSPGRPYVTNP